MDVAVAHVRFGRLSGILVHHRFDRTFGVVLELRIGDSCGIRKDTVHPK